MRYDRIVYKRNFLINPATMEHEHLGVEVQLDSQDNVDECVLQIRDRVSQWGQEIVGVIQKNSPRVVEDDQVEIEYESLKLRLFNTETYVEAADLLHKSPFRLVPELKDILNSKIGK